MDVLNIVMQWIVAPVAGFVWLLHLKTQQNVTDMIAGIELRYPYPTEE